MNNDINIELKKLADKERELCDLVDANFGGSIEGMRRRLKEKAVFQRYNELHKEYTQLAQAGSREALKRACFIQWYAAAEPDFLSGISGLNRQTVTQVFDLIENLATGNELDEEFKWMLAYYYEVAEFYIQHPKKYPAIIEASIKNKKERGWQQSEEGHLEGRGQLSDYWLSVTARK